MIQAPQGDHIHEQPILADRGADGASSPLLSQEPWPPARRRQSGLERVRCPAVRQAAPIGRLPTIMGGLVFASVLTLIAAPVLYYLFFKRSARREQAALPAAA